jgi:hypothetical protein
VTDKILSHARISEGGTYVPLDGSQTDSMMTAGVGKVIDILSFPWLWVAVGVAAVCALGFSS